MYDIIGDIHGYAYKLEKLLLRLGYELKQGTYVHSERKAIFVGDYIDRGPEIMKTLRIVKRMVDNGHAYAVMGNHEMGILNYYTQFKQSDSALKKNFQQAKKHNKSLRVYKNCPIEAQEYLNWIANLPLFIDLPDLRVVHACWNFELIEWVKANLPNNRVNLNFLTNCLVSGNIENRVARILLNGYSIKLPPKSNLYIKSKKINTIRIKWWLNKHENLSFKDFAVNEKWQITKEKVNFDKINIKLGYPETEKPLFIGHYWRKGLPTILGKNIACVDYSAANKNGQLVAYRFSKEKVLSDKNFITHNRPNIIHLTHKLLRRAMIL